MPRSHSQLVAEPLYYPTPVAAPDMKEMQRHELQCGRAQMGLLRGNHVQRLRRGGGGQTGRMGKDTAGRRHREGKKGGVERRGVVSGEAEREK